MKSISRILLITILLFSTAAQSQVRSLSRDSFSLEYPNTWSYKEVVSPNGGPTYMVVGPQKDGGFSFCQITQQSLLVDFVPRLAGMNDRERIKLFSEGGEELLNAVYIELQTMQDFKLRRTASTSIGKVVPAFLADFSYSLPEGFRYRVRSYYTFWSKAQISIWCQAVSRSEAVSERIFLENIGIFQSIISSVVLRR